jgi:organic radical activating enzyme
VVNFSLNAGGGRPAICIFLTGCDKPVKCFGCHNPTLWTHQPYCPHTIDSLIKSVKQLALLTRNVAIMGGEPLADYNLPITIELAKRLRKDGFKLFLYSWRSPKEVLRNELFKSIPYVFDYGILGTYEQDLKQDGFLASSNQEFIQF